jgi:hypothetical protein
VLIDRSGFSLFQKKKKKKATITPEKKTCKFTQKMYLKISFSGRGFKISKFEPGYGVSTRDLIVE